VVVLRRAARRVLCVAGVHAARRSGGSFRSGLPVFRAYEAYGYVDGGEFKLGSAAGKRPVTGNTGTDPENVHWDPYPGLVDANVPDITLSKDGEFTIIIAEKCAGLVGTGFGITNFWDYVGDQLPLCIWSSGRLTSRVRSEKGSLICRAAKGSPGN